MKVGDFFKKYGIHFIAVAAFIIAAVAYFSPQFDGYGLKQHDVEMHRGMSNEIAHYREMTGEEPLWTNSMFGGMPATQVSVLYSGNIIKTGIGAFLKLFPSPAGIFILHLISFYIMSLLLRIRPIIGIVGAFAFAFSSYEIVILQAGHNTKALAVAFAPLVLGAFIYSYKRNWKWGAILSGLFMTMELSVNHFQVTYYLAFLLFFLGAYYLVEAILKGTIKKFGFATVGIIGGYLLAGMMNYGNVAMTNDYAKHTIRGANDVTIKPDGTPLESKQKGLDPDYITNWSYGLDESFTFVSPYIKGSHNSFEIARTKFKETAENMDFNRDELRSVLNGRLYFGEQPITSGPVYLGVITVFLALLGMVFLKDNVKWIYLGVAVLALLLSWGKNFMGFTDFFINNVPGYNKFRTVTIILVLLELIFPVLAVLILQKFYNNREELKSQSKKFLVVSGAFVVFLIGLAVIGVDNRYASQREMEAYDETAIAEAVTNQLLNTDPNVLKQNYGVDVTNPQQLEAFVNAQVDGQVAGFEDMQELRAEVVSSSNSRSIIFAILGVGVIALFFFTSISSPIIIGALGVLMLIDLVVVDTNYLGTFEDAQGKYVHWTEKQETLYPMSPTAADLAILESETRQNPELVTVVERGEKEGKAKADELEFSGTNRRRVIDDYRFSALNFATDYRVFEFDGGFGSSRASYFHKSLGGYHGAKLRSIQNLMEFQISQSNNEVLNMLNVKYFIQQGQMRPNPQANGPAWLVRNIKTYESANDEIRALGSTFEVRNIGEGQFWVNGEKQDVSIVYGPEEMAYMLNGESIKVNLTNGMRVGDKAFFVMDKNGQTNLIPEQTMAMDTANSFTKLVSLELMDRFNSKTDAVMLAEDAKKLSSKSYTGEGTIKQLSYAPNKLVYEADLKGKQFIVFSEIYYADGWTATVDGKVVEILKTDYLLRGIEVDGGKCKIEFTFNLPAFQTAQKLAGTGSVIFILLIGFMFYMDWKSKKNRVEEA